MTGSFLYLDRNRRVVRLRVRECSDPATARAMLERELETAVRWEAGRG